MLTGTDLVPRPVPACIERLGEAIAELAARLHAASVHPLDPVTSRLACAGITIDARSVAVWDGTPFDVVWAVDVLRTREQVVRVGR